MPQADPDLALTMAQGVVDSYATASQSLLETIARRLAVGLDAPDWASRKLLETDRLRLEAQSVVDQLAAGTPDLVATTLADAYTEGAGGQVLAEFGRTSEQAVEALARETATAIVGTHGQIVRSSMDAYRAVIAEATAPSIVAGATSRRQAAQRALDRFADRGVTGFVDRSGRGWNLDSYVEMATRTATGRAQVAGGLDRIAAGGRDLVIVSDAPQECKVCRPWEGKVLSISGDTPGYPTVAQAQAAGLQHANCRHRLGAYVPGLTLPMRNTADPAGDDARQEQRRLERGVRQWKRREAAAMDPDAARKARAHRLQWQGRLEQHVGDHDLKRLRYRETPGKGRAGYTVPAPPDRLPFDPTAPTAKAKRERARPWEATGHTEDEWKRAKVQAKALRQRAKAEAHQAHDEAIGDLDRMGVSGSKLKAPPDKRLRRDALGRREMRRDAGGEWDWFDQQTTETQDRLRKYHLTKRGRALTPDQLQHDWNVVNDSVGEISVEDTMAFWIDATDRLDASRAVEAGRLPSFGLDPATVAPQLADEGYDVTRLLTGAVDDPEVIAHVADVERLNAQRHAWDLIRPDLVREGPPPWAMTAGSYADEVRELEYLLAETPTLVTEADWARYSELVPRYIDPDPDHPLSFDELHAVLVDLARMALS